VAGIEDANFFIDECLSPILAERMCERGINAIHPLHVGWRGRRDDTVLQRCIDEDRIIVTENARDFRKLVGRVEMHPGLIIFPSIDREGTWRLMEIVLDELEKHGDGRDYMFNRVLEVGEDGTIHTYNLPRS
jgi:predicted nuclease of predicted toxin-antitoxin system